LPLAYVECVQKVAFDQFKVYQRELFVLILSIEANKGSHDSIYGLKTTVLSRSSLKFVQYFSKQISSGITFSQ